MNHQVVREFVEWDQRRGRVGARARQEVHRLDIGASGCWGVRHPDSL
jgi:hypothetical protein